MFFDFVILHKRHKGRLFVPWTAATRGVDNVPKKDIKETDVSVLCKDIATYVCSKSSLPRDRFSLRFSSILINGTVKIHNKQVTNLLASLCRVLSQIFTMPAASPVEERGPCFFETPPTPLVKVRGKKRSHRETETPQSQIDKILTSIAQKEILQVPGEIELDTAAIARSDEITLRETQPCPVTRLGVEELGTLGTFPAGEEDIMALLRDQGIEELPPVQPQPIKPTEEIPLPTIHEEPPPKKTPVPKLTRASPPSPTLEPQTIVVEAQVHVSADGTPKSPPRRQRPRRKSKVTPPLQPDIEEILPAVASEERRKSKVTPPVQPDFEEILPLQRTTRPTKAVEEVRPRSLTESQSEEETRTATANKVRRAVANKLVIKCHPRRKVARIDRCQEDELEFTDMNPFRFPTMRVRVPANFTHLLNMYFISRHVAPLPREEKSSLTDRPSTSLTVPRKSGQITPEISVEQTPTIPSEVRRTVAPPIFVEQTPTFPSVAPPEVVPLPSDADLLQIPITSTPIVSKRPLEGPGIEQRTFEEIMAVGAEVRSPVGKIRKLTHVEQMVEKESTTTTTALDVEESRRRPSSIAVLPSEIAIDTVSMPAAYAEKERHQEIVNKVSESAGPLTLEDLCQRPLTKLNVARCFSDLLILCKAGYVNLIPEEDSIELKHIEKGRKLI